MPLLMGKAKEGGKEGEKRREKAKRGQKESIRGSRGVRVDRPNTNLVPLFLAFLFSSPAAAIINQSPGRSIVLLVN